MLPHNNCFPISDKVYYMSTDDLQNDAYRGPYPGDLLQIISDHQLQFDHETNTGIFCHLMSTLPEFGKLGVTCIGNSIQEAQRMSDRLIAVLDQNTAPFPKEYYLHP